MLVSLLLFPPLALGYLFHSLPDDLYAFPKYRVTFLNGLPLLNETAERWLREGLRGGESEFLDHPTPWQEPSPFKHIDAGEGTAVCPYYRLFWPLRYLLDSNSRSLSNLLQITPSR